MNDENSWNAILQGDIKAFSRLFNQYYKPLCNYAITILKYPDFAEELVQETFIKIWENRQNINIDVSLPAYLYRSVHNNCISHYRSQVANRKYGKEIYDETYFHARLATQRLSDDMLETIINGELEENLNQTIDKLPKQCKKVFYLSRYEQLTYKEIG